MGGEGVPWGGISVGSDEGGRSITGGEITLEGFLRVSMQGGHVSEDRSRDNGDVSACLIESEALCLRPNNGLDRLLAGGARVHEQSAKVEVLQKNQVRESLFECPDLERLKYPLDQHPQSPPILPYERTPLAD